MVLLKTLSRYLFFSLPVLIIFQSCLNTKGFKETQFDLQAGVVKVAGRDFFIEYEDDLIRLFCKVNVHRVGDQSDGRMHLLCHPTPHLYKYVLVPHQHNIKHQLVRQLSAFHRPLICVRNQSTYLFHKRSFMKQPKKGSICVILLFHNPSHNLCIINGTKYFQKGLPRGVCLLQEKAKVSHIVITESPIDALSHRQLYEKEPGIENTLYVCTCGSLSKSIKQELRYILEVSQKNHYKVTLAFDNDAAGKKMSKELFSIASSKNVCCQELFPSSGKDWNEELCYEVGVLSKLYQPIVEERSPEKIVKYRLKVETLLQEANIQFKSDYSSKKDLANLKYFPVEKTNQPNNLLINPKLHSVFESLFAEEHELEQELNHSRGRRKAMNLRESCE